MRSCLFPKSVAQVFLDTQDYSTKLSSTKTNVGVYVFLYSFNHSQWRTGYK